MRRAIVIGTGNATHAGGRAHTGFVVESSGGEWLLVDAGATCLRQLRRPCASAGEREALARLDAVLLTHFHGDHILGLPLILLYYRFDAPRRAPLTIAGPCGVEAVCRRLVELSYPALSLGEQVRFEEIDDHPIRLGSVTVEPFPVTHRPESLAYRLTGPAGKTIAISGDAALDERLLAAVRGADLAFVELSLVRQADPPLPHVALDELQGHADRLGARRLLFVHVDDEVVAAARLRGDRVEIAFEGQEVVL